MAAEELCWKEEIVERLKWSGKKRKRKRRAVEGQSWKDSDGGEGVGLEGRGGQELVEEERAWGARRARQRSPWW